MLGTILQIQGIIRQEKMLIFMVFSFSLGRQMVTQYPHKTISNGRCNEGKEYYNSNIYEAMAEELKVNKKE